MSDAHLGAAPAGAEERLVEFLGSVRGNADSLFVLGDLFDFWFEYGRAIPKHGFRVLAELAFLRRSGTRVVYLAGNHDFCFQDFFGRELGVETGQELALTIDGKRVWMSHGEGIDRRFVSAVFRRLMRGRVNNVLFSLLHPDLGIPLAGWVASRSRARGLDERLGRKMRAFAEAKLALGHDVVVMGHLHRPELHRTGNGVYLNVGDWTEHFSYGVIRDGEVKLERFGPSAGGRDG